ncbi:mechanosensitive ion channel [Mucilaginibacter sabulilitoris]|uniref:Mechanosensitive ion channel n=1 Tax=Mucilaginibacter sabulilitoris TaxID=1173583 RepID=A0ABZ0TL94_9SPHI|nr:mechanosensitive ion channel domain-containing protein [Mucilaginibacter sabulilitoris]WPU92963.1 mechanosensitive ion channel [Mucilaginibacter sabulilitoris]
MTECKSIRVYSHTKKCPLFFCILFISISALAQQKNADTVQNQPDRSVNPLVDRLKKIGPEETRKSIIIFNSEKKAIKQDALIEAIKKETLKANAYINTGIDTVGLNDEFGKIKKWEVIVGDGVFTNKGTAQTFRNLTTTSKILLELLNRTNARKTLIDNYEKGLVNFRYRIDSLSSDPLLFDFPVDSLLAVQYSEKLVEVAREIRPADKALEYAVNNIRKLQKEVNSTANKLSASLDEIANYQKELSSRTFEREFPNLGDMAGFFRPFSEIVHFSNIKARLNLLFYAQNNSGKVFLLLMLITASAMFLRSLKQIAIHENDAFNELPGQLVLRYPVLSAVIIVLSLGQFIFIEPPFIFNCLFWIISSICLTFIFRGFITKHWMIVWLTFFGLFIVSCIDNLILQASRTERWGMLILALIGVAAGLFMLIKGKKQELKEKLILYFIGLAFLLELASVFANIYGRYNLSKSLLVGGYLNVIIGILFLWTVRLINQGLCIASRVYTKQDKKLFYINFDLVGEKAPALLYFLLIIGWFILFGRNFYVFTLISAPLNDFFFRERNIGDYAFTINNLLSFFVIIAVATITSRIVSYFASDRGTDQPAAGKVRRAGVGSWLLLIRVGIMSIGLFLALAASGFPMERITIVMGALGLGIGLGLQALVNNLVSGLIIAFEKPVNVGDIVEISGQGGTMKSIGFRSSIISKWDGPDMVIPNGDLLNAHLVNWTLAGSKRQMEIALSVVHGTDLQKPQQIILDLLAANERIHQHPKPAVLFQNFNNGAIDIKVSFWVRDYKDGASVKSEIIMAIDAEFKKEGIVIPLPQQDLHIHAEKDLTALAKAKKTDKS